MHKGNHVYDRCCLPPRTCLKVTISDAFPHSLRVRIALHHPTYLPRDVTRKRRQFHFPVLADDSRVT